MIIVIQKAMFESEDSVQVAVITETTAIRANQAPPAIFKVAAKNFLIVREFH
jgi:hypothetical protein